MNAPTSSAPAAAGGKRRPTRREIEAQLLRMAAAGWRFELRTDERADVALLTFGQSTAYDVASLASMTP